MVVRPHLNTRLWCQVFQVSLSVILDRNYHDPCHVYVCANFCVEILLQCHGLHCCFEENDKKIHHLLFAFISFMG